MQHPAQGWLGSRDNLKVTPLRFEVRISAAGCRFTSIPKTYSLRKAIETSVKFNILSLSKLTTHVIALYINIISENCPKISMINFSLVSSMHFRTTRNSSKLYQCFIPQLPTNKLQRGIKYKGSKIWNSKNLTTPNLNVNMGAKVWN